MSKVGTGAYRNFHVPLTTEVYQALRVEAGRRRQAATAVVREAVEDWLEQRRAETLHTAIADYATSHAGTPADLDPLLEAAGIDALAGKAGATKRRRKKTAGA